MGIRAVMNGQWEELEGSQPTILVCCNCINHNELETMKMYENLAKEPVLRTVLKQRNYQKKDIITHL